MKNYAKKKSDFLGLTFKRGGEDRTSTIKWEKNKRTPPPQYE